MAKKTFNDAATTALDIILERYFTTGDPRLLQVLGENSAKKPDAAKTDMDRAIEGFLSTGDERQMHKLAMIRAWETQNTGLKISLLLSDPENKRPESPPYRNNADVLKILLAEDGAAKRAPAPDSMEIVKILLAAGAQLNPGTPLDHALRKINADPQLAVRTLLAAGAKVSLEEKQAGTSPQARPLILKI